jgi:hypothetical protein
MATLSIAAARRVVVQLQLLLLPPLLLLLLLLLQLPKLHPPPLQQKLPLPIRLWEVAQKTCR